MRMFSISSKHWFWSFSYKAGGNIIHFLQLERMFKKREAVGGWCFPLQNKKVRRAAPVTIRTHVTAPSCSEQVTALASSWCRMGKYVCFSLNSIPVPPGQCRFLSKCWDLLQLPRCHISPLPCGASQRSEQQQAQHRWEREERGALPVLQDSLWLLCIFKGLTPSHGEPL